MKLFMIRHCESEDDILNCYGGCADFELTDKEIAQLSQFFEKTIVKNGYNSV